MTKSDLYQKRRFEKPILVPVLLASCSEGGVMGSKILALSVGYQLVYFWVMRTICPVIEHLCPLGPVHSAGVQWSPWVTQDIRGVSCTVTSGHRQRAPGPGCF